MLSPLSIRRIGTCISYALVFGVKEISSLVFDTLDLLGQLCDMSC
jgi:hypothetical protein